MTNEEKLNQIMGSVELFINLVRIVRSDSYYYPITNKYLHSKQIITEVNSEPKLNKKFLEAKENAAMFSIVLEDFTKEVDFSQKWKDMSESEQLYILSFNTESYKIIRKVLPVEEVYVEKWRNTIYNIDVILNEKLMERLNLPVEMMNYPDTPKKLENWKNTLVKNGYNIEDFDNVIGMKNNKKEDFANNFLKIITKTKNNVEMTKILYETNTITNERKRTKSSFYQEYYFINQEHEFQKIKFKNDLEKELDKKPTDTIKRNKI